MGQVTSKANLLKLMALAIVFCSFYTDSAFGQDDGASVFKAKCSACHTVGGGTLVGPDLAAGKSWTNENLEAGIKRMQSTVGTLTDEQIAKLMEYLKSSPEPNKEDSVPLTHVGAENSSTGKAHSAQEIDIKGGSAAAGAELFYGRRAFKNGGMSCNSCHTVNGSSGMLGSDLGNISTKMNEAALFSACKQTPFKIMKAAYQKHEISQQEAMDLAKFLQSTDKQSRKPLPLPLYAGAGSMAILALIAVAYSKRNSGARKKLHRR